MPTSKTSRLHQSSSVAWWSSKDWPIGLSTSHRKIPSSERLWKDKTRGWRQWRGRVWWWYWWNTGKWIRRDYKKTQRFFKIKPKIVNFPKYCIILFRNVYILMKAKDIWKFNTINNDKVQSMPQSLNDFLLPQCALDCGIPRRCPTAYTFKNFFFFQYQSFWDTL